MNIPGGLGDWRGREKREEGKEWGGLTFPSSYQAPCLSRSTKQSCSRCPRSNHSSGLQDVSRQFQMSPRLPGDHRSDGKGRHRTVWTPLILILRTIWILPLGTLRLRYRLMATLLLVVVPGLVRSTFTLLLSVVVDLFAWAAGSGVAGLDARVGCST